MFSIVVKIWSLGAVAGPGHLGVSPGGLVVSLGCSQLRVYLFVCVRVRVLVIDFVGLTTYRLGLGCWSGVGSGTLGCIDCYCLVALKS